MSVMIAELSMGSGKGNVRRVKHGILCQRFSSGSLLHRQQQAQTFVEMVTPGQRQMFKHLQTSTLMHYHDTQVLSAS